MAYEFTIMSFELLSGRLYVEKLIPQGAALMETSNWVLGDMEWVILGGTVIFGLLVLNAYVQRIARIEEEQRLERLRSDRLKQERLSASQSR